MSNRLKVIVLSLTTLFLSSCGLFSSPSKPAPTEAMRLPSPTPSPIPDTLRPTDTPDPTSTSAALPTYHPTQTSLNASGPIVFGGKGGIWITSPFGDSLIQLSYQEPEGSLRLAISPSGECMALVIKNDQGLDLVLVDIPSGEKETITQLISLTPQDYYDATTLRSFATYAIRDYNSVAWQPGNGRLLAFIGAINGPTADLYLYDTQTREITQLTDGPSQAILPSWSPDGKYILHHGVSWVPPFGGAIGGANQMDGVWAVCVSDNTVITLPKPEGMSPHFVGWQDNTHYISYDSDDECFSQNLHSVDVVSRESTPIMEFSFKFGIARSPENDSFLFSSRAGCQNSLGDGVFLLLPDQTTPEKVLDKIVYEIRWLPESQVFQAYPEALLSSDGSTRYYPPVYDHSYQPAISIDGFEAWEVIENQKGRVVVRVPGGDWLTVLEGSVDQLIWDPIEGRTLLIALRDGSLYAASYPEFTPLLMGNLGGYVQQAVWLP